MRLMATYGRQINRRRRLVGFDSAARKSRVSLSMSAQAMSIMSGRQLIFGQPSTRKKKERARSLGFHLCIRLARSLLPVRVR